MINRPSKVLQAKETGTRSGCVVQSGSPAASEPDGSQPAWHATRHGFSLSEQSVRGQLVLTDDAPGLRRVSPLLPKRATACHSPLLLAVRSVHVTDHQTFSVGSAGSLPQSRVRGRVVDVQLDPSQYCPVRMHLYWRAAPGQLDLEVLTNCSDPLRDVEVQTSSCHTKGEVLVRAAARGSGWVNVHDSLALGAEWLVFPRDRVAGIISLDGRDPPAGALTLAGFYRQPVVLYRPAGQRWSYVEMSQPHDCMRVVVHVARLRTRVSFGLFGLDLEKGVILRGRVRGVFLPRANDTRQCLRHFSRFVTESPRLSV